MNRKNLEGTVGAMVSKWKEILNLRDWRIDVRIMEEELPGHDDEENVGACVYHEFSHHEAIIFILHPDKWKEIDRFWAERDESFLETIIVHELLHLHFSHNHPLSNWKSEREELAINQLTNAFMCLDEQINQPEAPPEPPEDTKGQ